LSAGEESVQASALVASIGSGNSCSVGNEGIRVDGTASNIASDRAGGREGSINSAVNFSVDASASVAGFSAGSEDGPAVSVVVVNITEAANSRRAIGSAGDSVLGTSAGTASDLPDGSEFD